MNKLSILFIILVLTQLVSAVTPGDIYTVTTIPICKSAIELKINGDDKRVEMNDFSFEQCSPSSPTEWICRCNEGGVFPLIMHTNPAVENTYDITVQYYLKDKEYLDNVSIMDDGYSIRHENTRTLNFDNIVVKKGVPSDVETSKESFTSSEGFILVIIILGACIIILGIIFAIYWLIKGMLKDEDEKPKPIVKKPIIIEPVKKTDIDKEVDDILKRL